METKSSNEKQGFWILTIFFGLMVVAGWGFLWVQPSSTPHQSSMMVNTMGSKMKNEIGSFTLADLFRPRENIKSSESAHHQGDSLVAKIHFATTSIIVVLFPFIVGGLVFLMVIWF
ncbi:MAG: hypothetical protein M0Z31_04760 [Clostridia bacterium]|nr:hypothetical protein [Clostridia bacterium]